MRTAPNLPLCHLRSRADCRKNGDQQYCFGQQHCDRFPVFFMGFTYKAHSEKVLRFSLANLFFGVIAHILFYTE